MFKALRFRFGIMFIFIFLAFFFDPMNGEFVWYMQSGTCNEYDFETRQCLSIEDPKTFPKLVALIDIPTLIFIWVFTICGSYFKSGNLVNKLERASHLSKDAGELCACLGGVLIFWGVFHEAAMADAFKYIFMAYLYGHFTAIILITIVNYLRSKEEDNTQINNSTATSSI
jgi:hypothetical protein